MPACEAIMHFIWWPEPHKPSYNQLKVLSGNLRTRIWKAKLAELETGPCLKDEAINRLQRSQRWRSQSSAAVKDLLSNFIKNDNKKSEEHCTALSKSMAVCSQNVYEPCGFLLNYQLINEWYLRIPKSISMMHGTDTNLRLRIWKYIFHII